MLLRRLLTGLILLALGLLGPRAVTWVPVDGGGPVLVAGAICGQPAPDAPGLPQRDHCPACVLAVAAVLPVPMLLQRRVPDVFAACPPVPVAGVLPPRHHPCPHGCGPPPGAVSMA
ncbi:hypothetical protein [Paracoccus jiaweipingae]|uniref:hypothetical protein n=1 Tax=unclassified Paracoccus (in: a-proteobacteria) TaxID=2688777 RepID=UPI00378D9EFA